MALRGYVFVAALALRGNDIPLSVRLRSRYRGINFDVFLR